MGKYEEHEFYCINCGHATIPLAREKGHKHKAFHRKKLYCPWCKQTCNCIEIRNLAEKEKFLEDFERGVYKNEAADSLSFVRSGGLG